MCAGCSTGWLVLSPTCSQLQIDRQSSTRATGSFLLPSSPRAPPSQHLSSIVSSWIGLTIDYGVSIALNTNFGQPETGPACRFPFCFLDISKRTIQLKMRVRTTASQDIFVGFNPLTIISGQGYISELIAQHSHISDDRSSPYSQKMNGECSFFESLATH